MNRKTFLITATLALIVAGSVGANLFLVPSNIDPANKYSWSENTGWMNWRDADAGNEGVLVGEDFLTGYVWAENIGWIDTGDGSGPYANATGLDFGVNILGNDDLDGFAWSENAGWVNFGWAASTANADRARYDTGAGRFRGWVWGENMGWINLDDATHYVATAAAAPSPLIANPFGTCTGNNAVCDVDLNNCPVGQTCDTCGQVRSMSFQIPADSAGTDTAVRVRLTSLHHPAPNPPAGPPPDFSAFEGEYRYLNTIPGTLSRCCNPASNPTACNTSVSCNSDADCIGLGLNTKCEKNLCPDSPAFATFFRCARLGCTPEYRDWGTDFSSLITYVSGDAVIPDSSYELSHLAASCAGNEAACGAASAEIEVRTERWGNVDCTTAVIPSAVDIGFVVSKVKDSVGAMIKPRTQLREATPNPLGLVNALDISRVVDAVKGFNYPFTVAVCP